MDSDPGSLLIIDLDPASPFLVAIEKKIGTGIRLLLFFFNMSSKDTSVAPQGPEWRAEAPAVHYRHEQPAAKTRVLPASGQP